MKTMKKLASLTLALLLTVALAAPAFAAGEAASATGSITITDTAQQQTYNAYRLLDLKTYDNGTNSFLYTVNSDWAEFFADTTDNGGAKYVVINESPDYENETYVTWKEGAAAADLAAAAKDWLDAHPIAAVKTATSDANGASFADLPLGYYLVDSTVGTLCFLDTTNPDVEIAEKNELPTVSKKIVSGEERVDTVTANYGDTITFEITVKFPESTTEDITVNDTMAAGLTYTGNLTATTGEVTVGSTVPLTFTLPASETNKTAGNVIFTYTATLDVNAVTATALTNSVNLTYKDGEEDKTTTTSTVTVYTYAFDLVKTKSDNSVLGGATFKLYGSETGTDEIPVIRNADGTYSVVPAGTEGIVDITAGNVTIKGLADKTYYLEETAAPAGYNKLATRAPVSSTVDVVTDGVVTGKDNNEATVTDGKYESGGVQVVNLTGAEMPSTGGIGTTIFYIVGGLLVVGAGVILIARKKVGED